MCVGMCEQASDCGQPSPLFDDNWACNDSQCEWTGCMNDGECQAAFMNGNYVCRDVDGSGVDQCVPTCNVANDCAQPSPLYDNNWACSDDGECEWQGCTDDTECQAAFMNGNYICGDKEGFDVPQCIATCEEANDCTRPSPLYDGDNWTCERERCEWLGCNDDQECMSGLMSSAQVCVDPR